MKKVIITLFLLSTMCYADQSLLASALVDADTMFAVTEEAVPVDTVNIGEMVRSQIEAAQMSTVITSVAYGTPRKEEKKPAPLKIEKKQEESSLQSLVLFLHEFNGKYSNIIIFAVSSVLILSVVFGRRFVKVAFTGSKGRLKKGVNLIRSEKPVHRDNKKINELRRKLAESSSIYEISEASISEKAKDLNVGTGELMLAAKVKAFQLSKILSR